MFAHPSTFANVSAENLQYGINNFLTHFLSVSAMCYQGGPFQVVKITLPYCTQPSCHLDKARPSYMVQDCSQMVLYTSIWVSEIWINHFLVRKYLFRVQRRSSSCSVCSQMVVRWLAVRETRVRISTPLGGSAPLAATEKIWRRECYV